MSLIEHFEHQGVVGFRLGRFRSGFHTTAVVYMVGSTLIDSGPPNQWKVVRDLFNLKRIDRVLLTHHHEDHAGNGARIRQELRIPVFSPAGSVEPLSRGFSLYPYQRIVWGTPRSFEPDNTVPGRMEFENGISLEAISVPGHAPDLTCYHAPDQGWLFAGDLFITPRPTHLRKDEDIHQEIQSLYRVLGLDFEVLFCGHRGVLTEGHQAIREKLNYLESLRDQVQGLQREGKPDGEITRILLGREDAMTWATTFHFSKKNLIRSFISGE